MKTFAWRFEHNGIVRVEWAVDDVIAAEQHARVYGLDAVFVLSRLTLVGPSLSKCAAPKRVSAADSARLRRTVGGGA